VAKLSRRLLISLKPNHLTETGAVVIYKIQAKLVKDITLKEKLQRFSRGENIHKNELNEIIIRYGSYPLPLEKITRLKPDIYLEKSGVLTYRKQKSFLLDKVDNETIEKYNVFIKMEEGHLKWLTEWAKSRLPNTYKKRL
jgi:rubrerythrin